MDTDLLTCSWPDLDRLPVLLDEAGRAADLILDHAVTWACRDDGFAPSPVCVLRPLAGVLDEVADGFAAVRRGLLAELAATGAAVAAARGGLEATERGVADGFRALAGAV
ncbi:hypothetical protein [Nocardioides sp. SYSU D00038]|uniref:hypothetical protein n=1 Tax=Nocardioides sp. SYSU D00038 TaxID=2812554 RepID=UPI001967FE07|nr:hypothetical protein [Nocardioides sp. SYSU D00038]